MIRLFYIVNKRGDLRLTRYFEHREPKERVSLQTQITRECFNRGPEECSFFPFQDMTVVYRKYSSLFFIAGVTQDENELGILELIHNFVLALNEYFTRVTESDILFSLDRVHMVIDEMMPGGAIGETNIPRVLLPLQLLDASVK